MMRNDQLALVQEHVADSHRFIQQAARIAAHIQNQAVERWRIQFLHGIGNFAIRGFIEWTGKA